MSRWSNPKRITNSHKRPEVANTSVKASKSFFRASEGQEVVGQESALHNRVFRSASHRDFCRILRAKSFVIHCNPERLHADTSSLDSSPSATEAVPLEYHENLKICRNCIPLDQIVCKYCETALIIRVIKNKVHKLL